MSLCLFRPMAVQHTVCLYVKYCLLLYYGLVLITYRSGTRMVPVIFTPGRRCLSVSCLFVCFLGFFFYIIVRDFIMVAH